MIILRQTIQYILSAIFLISIITCSSGDGNRLPTEEPAQLEFNNMVHTPIVITVDSETYTIPVGGTLTLDFEANPGVVPYYATSGGKTSSDTDIGLQFEWDLDVDLTDMDYDFVDLIIGQSYFFLQYQNNGGINLTPLYVNYGSADQTMDNIFLPNDNVKYNTGYYRANAGNEIRTYWDDQSGTYWFSTEGTHYSYPSGNNKLVLITVNQSGKQGITKNWTNTKFPETLDIESSSKAQTKGISRPVFGQEKN